ncbi:MAG: hypothetical protein IKZ39_02185, partial [Lachnospiraceae bacterium]|nr:hypothetical protein [Lachnospiraceae bacterium]
MRRKIIALLICLSLFTGMIAGCGAKESEPESAGNQTVSESAVNAGNEAVADKETETEEKSSYKVTGDPELDRAIYLGFVTKDELAEDRTVKGSEAFA